MGNAAVKRMFETDSCHLSDGIVIEGGDTIMSIVDQAIEFAAHAHWNQKRKGTEIPYISHPYAVGMILQRARCKEEVIVAGILHDTLEDTDTSEVLEK